jgi:transposase
MNGSLSHLKNALQEVALPENLQSPFNQLLELLDAVLEENKQLLQRVKLLEEQLAVYRQDKFGRQSEKSSVLKSSPALDGKETAPGGMESAPQSSVSVLGYTRKPRAKGRTVDMSRLLHTDIVHDLSLEEKVCAHCQRELRQMVSEVAEQLERLPEILYVARHIRMKYVCRHCDQIKMAPKLPSPVPKCLAGASLLADVIVRKFQYHLPLYRQSKILASQGIEISDSTLGHWVKQSAEVLLPLIEALWQVVRSEHYLQCDESPVLVVTAQKKGYLWVYLAPRVGNKKGLVSFQFALTREAKVVENHLARFSGLLQTDGYGGYQKLCAEKRIIDFGCWAHVRRKFVTVVEVSHSQEGKASEMLVLIGELYAVEKVARDLKLCPRDRKRLRKKRKASLLLKNINRWLLTVEPNVPPKSGLGKAINYALNQWPRLIRYVRHGEVEIDNNLVENQIRGPAVGKSNWMFVQREENGRTNAGYYSLIHSCILNEINPAIYIHYVLTQAHAMRKKTVDPKSLLPHCIDKKLLEQFSQQQQMIMQKILNTS